MINNTDEEIKNMNCDMVCLECGSSERDKSGFGGMHGHGPDGWYVSFTCDKCKTHHSKDVSFSKELKTIKLNDKLYKEFYFDTKLYRKTMLLGIIESAKDRMKNLEKGSEKDKCETSILFYKQKLEELK